VETGHGARPQATRFVFAYTNKDVNALNEDLRAARGNAGAVRRGRALRDEARAAMFAVGDRVQFTDTRKSAKIYNGNVGTITASTRAPAFCMRDSMDRRGAGARGRLVGVGVRRF